MQRCLATIVKIPSPSRHVHETNHTQVAFVIGGLRRQTSTLKPFNPILGETYQAQYSSGVRVYAEQISHHPPVSSWQVEDAQGRVRVSHDSFLPTHVGTALQSVLGIGASLPGEGQQEHLLKGSLLTHDVRRGAGLMRQHFIFLQFIFSGNGNWKASARGNSIWGQQSGRNRWISDSLSAQQLCPFPKILSTHAAIH